MADENDKQKPDETTADATAAKDTAPADEATAADAPKDEAPKEDAPKEDTPTEDAPKDEAPKDEAPKDEAPKDEEKPAGEQKPKAAKPKRGEQAAGEGSEADEEPDAKAGERPKKPSRRRRRGKGAAEPQPAKRKRPSEPILGEDGQPILVKAQSKYVRASARKARLVVDNIRGQSVAEARVTLAFTQRRVAKDVAKVLESAIANAEHNHELDPDDLHVAIAFADEGPTFKRWQPRARGRATPIMKRTSHITVVVSPTPAKDLEKYRKAAA